MIKANRKAIVKDVDAAKRTVIAYGNAFGNEDEDGDIIVRGAYSKTIKERGPGSQRPRIKVVWQHDWTEPLSSPFRLEEDNFGLLTGFTISDTRRGRDAITLYNDGVITEHSVRINEMKRRDEDRRYVTEVKLWEISPVTWGANALTPVVELKSFDALSTHLRQLKDQITRAQAAMKSTISEELGYSLEMNLALWNERLDIMIKSVGDMMGEPTPQQPAQSSEELNAYLKGILSKLDQMSALTTSTEAAGGTSEAQAKAGEPRGESLHIENALEEIERFNQFMQGAS